MKVRTLLAATQLPADDGVNAGGRILNPKP